MSRPAALLCSELFRRARTVRPRLAHLGADGFWLPSYCGAGCWPPVDFCPVWVFFQHISIECPGIRQCVHHALGSLGRFIAFKTGVQICNRTILFFFLCALQGRHSLLLATTTLFGHLLAIFIRCISQPILQPKIRVPFTIDVANCRYYAPLTIQDDEPSKPIRRRQT
jgi:hypothetical protein